MKIQRLLGGFSLAPAIDQEDSIALDGRVLRTLRSDWIWRVEAGEFLAIVGDHAANELLSASFWIDD